MTGPAAPRGLVRAMLDHERAAFTRPVTCPFWRFALSGGIMAATGGLIDTAPGLALLGLTLAYGLVDWAWIRATWRAGRGP